MIYSGEHSTVLSEYLLRRLRAQSWTRQPIAVLSAQADSIILIPSFSTSPSSGKNMHLSLRILLREDCEPAVFGGMTTEACTASTG